ncbi:CPBP family intramembrane glutamic endopeptidase [Cochlodiniinecator piscidefendens]|uniref:CPBP family intramembrane glutamic endopeptidase n=1 Tax=Cochlodiniinecator piscidefendens TaxID=2715756 RepID=UPI00140C9C3B|nr:CPBP family intramembrane glutamic endopeptidase [Cochlodiniinecator piscidefendens]
MTNFFQLRNPLICVLIYVTYLSVPPNSVPLPDFLLEVVMVALMVFVLRDSLWENFQYTRTMSLLRFLMFCIGGFLFTQILFFSGVSLFIAISGSETSDNQAAVMETIAQKNIIATFLTIAVVGPVLEELVFRKSIFDIGNVIKVPFAVTLLISATLFGLVHVIFSGDWLGSIPYIFMGLGFGLVYHFSRSFIVVAIVHMLSNTPAFFT